MCVCVCVCERERVNEAVKISGLSLVIERFQPGLMPSPVTQVLSGKPTTTGEADHP